MLPVGQPNTVYAHVWNLGRAPLTGVVVSFYWFNPSLAIDGAHAHLIGQTRVDLGPRNSPLCHKLVKCPKAWVPVMENGGHECLVVKVWGFGDAVADTQWSPWLDRHVAQRNVSVVQTLGDMQKIISRIQLATRPETRFELVQVGAEARDAVKIVASKLTLDPALPTRSLAHLDAKNLLTVTPTDSVTPRIMPHILTGLAGVAGLAGAAGVVKAGGAADVGDAGGTPETGGAAGLGTRRHRGESEQYHGDQADAGEREPLRAGRAQRAVRLDLAGRAQSRAAAGRRPGPRPASDAVRRQPARGRLHDGGRQPEVTS